MKCPKCNIELEKGICIKCGYMENGNIIEQFKDTNQHTNVRLYNEDFDQMNTNQNKFLNLIMGSYYFSYRGHLITGLISTIIASIILFFELKLINALAQLGTATMILIFINTTIYITINRIIYMSFSNPICIGLDKKKSKKIQDTNKLIMHKCRNIPLLIIHKCRNIPLLIIHILLSIIPIILILKNI